MIRQARPGCRVARAGAAAAATVTVRGPRTSTRSLPVRVIGTGSLVAPPTRIVTRTPSPLGRPAAATVLVERPGDRDSPNHGYGVTVTGPRP